MNGLTILSHSFRQVTGNLGMAIRVSGWLVAICVIGGGMLVSTQPEWLNAALNQNMEGMADASSNSGGSAGLVLLLTLAVTVFLFWSVSLVAIVWHRFILLEEIPQGIIPYRKEFRIGRYFWLGVGISLLAGLVVVLVSGILGAAFGPFLVSSMQGMAGGQGSGMVGIGFLMGLLVGTIVAVLYLRMALVLPAVALDDSLTIRQAWGDTSGHTWAIVGLALALAFINMVVPMVINLAFGEMFWVSLAAMGLYQWFYFMLSISILSTLYGHIVQKREVH
ncbi:MAG: hypothetical protein COB08_000095 [Rhodobacteraceae bacterium]|nr:hypothetical protein [Paracoccaceae bacterium]